MNKDLARKLRVRQVTRKLLMKFSNIPSYKSAENYFDNRGNLVEILNYCRIPGYELKVEAVDWKRFLYNERDELIKIVDAKHDIELSVTDDNRNQIDLSRYYVSSHSGYIYSIFGHHINFKKYFQLKGLTSFASSDPVLRLYNETIDTTGQTDQLIRYSALDTNVINSEGIERENLPPREVLIFDDANIIEFQYEYIHY
jgi:hypothetical protein